MKAKIYVFFLILAMFNLNDLFSQVILTSENNNHQLNDQYLSTIVMDSISPGDNGANILWDFSLINSGGITRTYNVIPPSEAAYSFAFPTANYVIQFLENDTYYNKFYRVDSLKKEYLGNSTSGINSDFTGLTNTEDMIVYPMYYTSTFSDNFYWVDNIGNNILFYFNGVKYVAADSFGTIILPTGVFTDVLRIVDSTIIRVTSSIGPPNEGWITKLKYSWYSESKKHPIFSIFHEENIFYDDTLYFNNYEIFDYVTNDINETCKNDDILIYPNPSKGQVTIEIKNYNLDNYSLIIIDQYGKKVLNKIDIKSQIIYLKQGELPKGVYTILIIGDHIHSSRIIIN
jgi:hypothetical protein